MEKYELIEKFGLVEKSFLKPELAKLSEKIAEKPFFNIVNLEIFGENCYVKDSGVSTTVAELMKINSVHSAWFDELHNVIEIENLLKENGYFEVKKGFDKYSISDIREIKEQLPQEFIDCFNACSEVE